ncbi:unnamed protein product, partial [Ectocarpus fasciculatus]
QKISIKTLKGEQFEVEVEIDDEISVVKTKVTGVRADIPAARQKLIHAGKVLKDDATLRSSGVAENDFIVCMLTKEVAPKVSLPPSRAGRRALTMCSLPGSPPTPAPAPAVAPVPVSVAAPPTPATTAVAPPAPPAGKTTARTGAAPAAAPAAPAQFEDPAALQQLLDMGFPEQECRAALRAAFGNSGVAVEYLMSGIPPQVQQEQQQQQQAPSPGGVPAAPMGGAASGDALDGLRRHPQLNMLKRLVQENPAALGRVLEAIGQQNPELLQAIHADQPAFLALMNEPIVEEPAGGVAPAAGGLPDMGGAGAAGGMRNPAELLQMLMSLPEEMRGQASAALGMTPEQLQGFTQMLSSLPPDQLQQMMAGMGGAGGGGGGSGQNVIRLTEEEMASVTRLTELGFDQQDAAAAYLACDKNEALAANLLLEGWQAGGDGGDMMDMGGDGGDDFGGDDNMYS